MVAEALRGQAAPTRSQAAWSAVPSLETPAEIPKTWVPGVTASAQDEVFRAIAIQAGSAESGVLAIASACPGEGRSTLALALASITAQDYPARRVVYVETDFARPQLAVRLEIQPNPGLLDCLVRDQPTADAMHRQTALRNLSVVPAGGPDLTPNRWLCSRDVAETVAHLRRTYDLVVLDLPALTEQGGALSLMHAADRVLFVVRAGATPAPIARHALAQVPADKLTGVVLNSAKSHVPGWIRRLAGLT